MKPGKYAGRHCGCGMINSPLLPIRSLKPHTFLIRPPSMLLYFTNIDWDRLGSEYADSSVLIGDVDCTADGESLCEEHEIRGCKCDDLMFNTIFHLA